MIEMLRYDFMWRALAAALLVGLSAPAVGTFIVQRRLALLGDGIGHVALTGVALGFLTGTAPVLTAVVVAVLGAVAIELVRARGRTTGDVALALLFYGGIAGGVLLIGLAPGGSNATLTSYLFGSISSVSGQDVWVIAVLAAFVLGVVAVFGRELFVLCQDEDVARVNGLPVRFLSLLVAVTAALTVVIAMRVVGLLLVSALMVVPVATSQQITRGFVTTMLLAMGLGVIATVGGLTSAFYAGVAPGAAIVLLALSGFVIALGVGRFVRRGRAQQAGP
ncbi:ABC transporter [Sphaerisporangium krabiense]|uniref:Zinc transport system permease protein n=1 Tax=Sphaerisporangium krabiense TaxID=763782 RepID=A0A7W8Z7B7_9ACTN|nr:metal ABC transporter permease [Sphaerisporangium krabiense]MBB5628842.1 zinc transport system permease protein [Sphaerisporangium krabiense]GII60317.1 ABC transporter [Sphaerisporangium krabiense]